MNTTTKVAIGAAALAGAVYFLAKRKGAAPAAKTAAAKPGARKLRGMGQWVFPADVPSPNLVSAGGRSMRPCVGWWDRLFGDCTTSPTMAGLGQELPNIDVIDLFGGGSSGATDEQTSEAMQQPGVIPTSQPAYQGPIYPTARPSYTPQPYTPVRPTIRPTMQYGYGTQYGTQYQYQNPYATQYATQYNPYAVQQYPIQQYQTAAQSKWTASDALVTQALQVGLATIYSTTGKACTAAQSQYCNARFKSSAGKKLSYAQVVKLAQTTQYYGATAQTQYQTQYQTGTVPSVEAIAGLGATPDQQCVPQNGWWLTLNAPTNGSAEFHAGYRPQGA